MSGFISYGIALLELHNGASPESFRSAVLMRPVSAIEISSWSTSWQPRIQEWPLRCHGAPDVHANCKMLLWCWSRGYRSLATLFAFSRMKISTRAALIRTGDCWGYPWVYGRRNACGDAGLVHKWGFWANSGISPSSARKSFSHHGVMDTIHLLKVMWGGSDQRTFSDKILATAKELPEVSQCVKEDFEALRQSLKVWFSRKWSLSSSWFSLSLRPRRSASDCGVRAMPTAIIRPSEKWVPEIEFCWGKECRGSPCN